MCYDLKKLTRMKKIVFLSLVSILLFAGCEKIDKLTQFDMGYKMTVVIPSSTGLNLPFNFFTPDVQTDSEATFAIHSTSKELIEEVLLTKLTLTLTSPGNGNLGFIKSIDVFISAEGLPEEKISWKTSSSAAKTIELDVTGKDLKEYIKKDEFKLRLSTVTNELLTSEHKIEVNANFFVDAKVLGQ